MKELIKNLPGIKNLRRFIFEKKFETHENVNYFRGVFSNFANALNSAPKSKPIGYDNEEASGMYEERTRRVYSTDYPVLYWINRKQKEIKSVFDFGGHIGIHYYSYSKFLDYSKLNNWTVCDVPKVTEKGKKESKHFDQLELSFSNNVLDCDGSDLFLANGSIQYLDWELSDKLNQLTAKPKFVLLNMTPIHPKVRTITLQSIGTSFCPYHIRLRKEFLEGMKGAGYLLVDEWENPEKSCNIAFELDRSLNNYSGFFFELKNN
ncbi:MAG: putative methyltransferase (TIGR04325 family) [Bacteriovoracaceae bacterium]|jgi:putative methyltransferase (TIGR04325 family)